MIRTFVLTGALLLAARTAMARPAKPVELTGILTQIAGAVQLAGPGIGAVPLASPWQVLRRGVTIRIPEGGAAGVVCSNRRFVRLQGPRSWPLDEAACAAGRLLEVADYSLLATQAGRFSVVHGLMVLERDMREGDGDDPWAPLVLSPRNTVVQESRPAVSWLRVPQATEYQVEWNGTGASGFTKRLDASAAACALRSDGLDVCSLPWPAERSGLPWGGTFFLKISARGGIVEPWHANDSVAVTTLTAACKLEARLQHLSVLGLEGGALESARAGVLAREGLYGDAAEAYRRALSMAPSAELRVTLADVDLAMGLDRLALPLYRRALEADELAVRAAAAFGLGRLLYSRHHYQEAIAELSQARDLYAGLRLNEEEAAARRAIAQAAARLPQ
jgi:hypothetical protein